MGMKRPKKKKVEAAEATEASAEVKIDMGDAEDEQDAPGSQGVTILNPALAPSQVDQLSPFEKAAHEWEKAGIKAVAARRIAKTIKKAETMAEKLYEVKLKRLDGGDKRNKRKSPLRAVFRRYEAQISLLQAQHKSEWFSRRAAELETAAAVAEAAMWKVERARAP